MSESKYTPGPWSREWIHGALRHINRNVDWDAFYVPTEGTGDEEINVPQASDSALVAAAPDLLDCARKALDTFNDTAKVLGLLGHHTSAEAMLIAATYTANVIAKAEGR